MWPCVVILLFLREASPEPSPIKQVQHFLLQILDGLLGLVQFRGLVEGRGSRSREALHVEPVEPQLVVVAAAVASDAARRRRHLPPLLQPQQPSLPPHPERAAAQAGGYLVHGEDEEASEAARAAARHGGALGRGPAGHLREPHAGGGLLARQQRLPAVARRRRAPDGDLLQGHGPQQIFFCPSQLGLCFGETRLVRG